MTAPVIDFPEPPRVTGNQLSDLPIVVDYLWKFYAQSILSGGLLQTSALATQLGAMLAGLAALTGSDADKMPYFTAPNTWAIATITLAGRALLAAADAAAQRAEMGLGTMAVQGSGAVSITGGTMSGIIPFLNSYTVAGVPAAVDSPNGLIRVSNEAGGATVAVSNGVNWLRVSDGAIIS